jgi:hypothetical protein
LYVTDAKSVDGIHAALKEQSDLAVNSPWEENENNDDYGGTAESTKYDTPEQMQAESQINVGDGRETDEQRENTSNTSESQ